MLSKKQWDATMLVSGGVPCPYAIGSDTCDTCGGDGKVDGPGPCSHKRNSTHSYCGHRRVGQHD